MSAVDSPRADGGAADNPSIPQPPPLPPEPAPRTLTSYERRDVRNVIAKIRGW